jgi:hypothetical protein
MWPTPSRSYLARLAAACSSLATAWTAAAWRTAPCGSSLSQAAQPTSHPPRCGPQERSVTRPAVTAVRAAKPGQALRANIRVVRVRARVRARGHARVFTHTRKSMCAVLASSVRSRASLASAAARVHDTSAACSRACLLCARARSAAFEMVTTSSDSVLLAGLRGYDCGGGNCPEEMHFKSYGNAFGGQAVVTNLPLLERTPPWDPSDPLDPLFSLWTRGR